jgi:DnaJ family protein B protein 4
MGGGGQTFHFTSGGGGGMDANDIFKSFFGTSDPFAAGGGDDPFGGMGGGGGGGFSPFGMAGMGGMGGGMGGRGGMQDRPRTLRKSEPISYDLNVNLDDLYTGKLKKVRITKKVADEASGRIEQKKVDKEIHVRPGWKDGTKITFERAGDELPGIQPADIIFVIRTRPHEYFERDGDDLIYNVSLLMNLRQCFQFYFYSLCCVLCYRSVRSLYNKRYVDLPPQ